MNKLMWSALAVLLFAGVARAQETPPAPVEVASGYAHFHIIKGFTIPLDGASGSVAVNANNWLGVAGDFGVYHSHGGLGLGASTFTFGPRVSYRKAHWVTPFAEALFGGVYFSSTVGGVPNSTGTHFIFGLGAGVDIALTRRGAFALRPEGEYFGWHGNGSTINNARLGIGIVYRIRRR